MYEFIVLLVLQSYLDISIYLVKEVYKFFKVDFIIRLDSSNFNHSYINKYISNSQFKLTVDLIIWDILT